MTDSMQRFHRLWSERVHQSGYDKHPWSQLCNVAEWADKYGDDALRLYVTRTAEALARSQGSTSPFS